MNLRSSGFSINFSSFSSAGVEVHSISNRPLHRAQCILFPNKSAADFILRKTHSPKPISKGQAEKIIFNQQRHNNRKSHPQNPPRAQVQRIKN